MPVLAVVPARLGSTRLPHKPLQLLAGQPLVVRVAERVSEIGVADRVVVATDAEAIVRVARAAGFEALMTSAAHATGTDRVAEVAAVDEYRGFDMILNVQGDEPFVSTEACAGAIDRVRMGDDVGTAASPLASRSAADPSVVKVVMDEGGRALYFSRAAIPFSPVGGDLPAAQYWQHHGIYASRPSVLQRWAALPPTVLERRQRLEQLRALEHGFMIGVARLEYAVPPGIDTESDLQRAEAIWDLVHQETR